MREKRRDDFFIAAKLLMPMTFAAKSLFALDNRIVALLKFRQSAVMTSPRHFPNPKQGFFH
jgi:hypothetical protein